MKFNNKPPEWDNEGTTPSEKLKTTGFRPQYKPSANVFNWFFSLVGKCINELQEVLTARTDVKIIHSGEATDAPNTLYLVVEGDTPEPKAIQAVAYDNVEFSPTAPKTGENWFKTTDAEAVQIASAEPKYVIENGRLTVLKEPEKDTKFLNK